MSYSLIPLQLILQRIYYGELPCYEISRENFRDFIHYQLGVDLLWDKVTTYIYIYTHSLSVSLNMY